jgi:hypothetical protein
MRLLAALGGLLLVGCLPSSSGTIVERDAGPSNAIGPGAGDASADVRGDAGASLLFDLFGATPSHGPFNGGTRVLLTGRGFPSNLKVAVNNVDVQGTDVTASEPQRATVIMPAGKGGFASISVTDPTSGHTRKVSNAFFYDSFYVEPASGSTVGGTRVRVTADGLSFDSSTSVTIDGKPCTGVSVEDKTHLSCTTPGNTAGSKEVTVTTGAATTQARDAYVYGDGPDGYRGGLSGAALAGKLNVFAFDGALGSPIADALVVAGTDVASIVKGTTSASGVASLTGNFGAKISVTVAAKCYQPVTFVDVPVETVSVLMSPIMSPECMEGDPSSTGNYPTRLTGDVTGELVWPSIEFKRSAWVTVPQPSRSSERQAAYVFSASGYANESFYLPSDTAAVTPSSSGKLGYSFKYTALAGTQTLYALAGIEDRSVSPPIFTAYVMGVARGVSVPGGATTTGVTIPMRSVFDHGLALDLTPPSQTPRGPDRVTTQVALTVGPSTFAILPTTTRLSPLPAPASIGFSGLPALTDDLTSESYALTLLATSGPYANLPASGLNRYLVRTSKATVAGFLPIPALSSPTAAKWNGKQLSFEPGASIDLAVVIVSSGGGLVGWVVVVPGSVKVLNLPDLAAAGAQVSLVKGPIDIRVFTARVDPFEYGKLRYGQLYTNAWAAYAAEAFSSNYE